jgi:hypothetical protein
MKLVMIVATAILALTATAHAIGPARNTGHSVGESPKGKSPNWER